MTEDGIYASEAGEFEIFIGKDSLTGNKASFVLKNDLHKSEIFHDTLNRMSSVMTQHLCEEI